MHPVTIFPAHIRLHRIGTVVQCLVQVVLVLLRVVQVLLRNLECLGFSQRTSQLLRIYWGMGSAQLHNDNYAWYTFCAKLRPCSGLSRSERFVCSSPQFVTIRLCVLSIWRNTSSSALQLHAVASPNLCIRAAHTATEPLPGASCAVAQVAPVGRR